MIFPYSSEREIQKFSQKADVTYKLYPTRNMKLVTGKLLKQRKQNVTQGLNVCLQIKNSLSI